MLVEKITNALERIVSRDRERYTSLVADRFRNEIPLQGQIFEAVRHDISTLEREKGYERSRGKCDFWCRADSGGESWIELKLCATNYCQYFSEAKKSIGITQQIGQVILDCKKLGKIEPRHERKIVLLAYPMPVGEEHPRWRTHVTWILEYATAITLHRQLLLRRNSMEAAINVYVIDV